MSCCGHVCKLDLKPKIIIEENRVKCTHIGKETYDNRQKILSALEMCRSHGLKSVDAVRDALEKEGLKGAYVVSGGGNISGPYKRCSSWQIGVEKYKICTS